MAISKSFLSTKIIKIMSTFQDLSHFATHLPIKGNTFDTFMNDKKEDIIIFFLLSFSQRCTFIFFIDKFV